MKNTKYIRTKDRIFRRYKNSKIIDNVFYYPDDGMLPEYRREPILKQADTIEELCDVFVYKKELYKQIEKGEDLENQTRIRLFGISFFDLYIEEWNNIYGAIWTSKGLIYVAKMNEKGELELL